MSKKLPGGAHTVDPKFTEACRSLAKYHEICQSGGVHFLTIRTGSPLEDNLPSFWQQNRRSLVTSINFVSVVAVLGIIITRKALGEVPLGWR